MRAIDADALKRKMQRVATEAWKMKVTAKVETIMNQFIDFIEEQPTIEPELIRCEDCKHYNAGFECLIEGYGIERNKNWFCGDAERRTND